MSMNHLPKPRLTEFLLREHGLAVALSALTRWDTLSDEELISLGFAPGPSSDPTEEIEVTPEMAEAGAAELARYTEVFDTLEDGATRIFRAMIRASRLDVGRSLDGKMDKSVASEKTKPWNDPVWIRALKIPFVAGETWAEHFQRAKDDVERATAVATSGTVSPASPGQ